MNLRVELRGLVGGSLPLPSGGRTHGRGDSYQPNAFPFGGRAHGRGRLLPTQRIAFGEVVSDAFYLRHGQESTVAEERSKRLKWPAKKRKKVTTSSSPCSHQNPVRVAWSFRRPVEWVQPYIVHRKRPPTFHFRINENQLLMILKPYVKKLLR